LQAQLKAIAYYHYYTCESATALVSQARGFSKLCPTLNGNGWTIAPVSPAHACCILCATCYLSINEQPLKAQNMHAAYYTYLKHM